MLDYRYYIMARKTLFNIPNGADIIGELLEEMKEPAKAFLKKYDIKNYSFREGDGVLPEIIADVQESVRITKSDLNDKGSIPFKFGRVSGSFICNDCGLTSLYNAPDEVGDIFCCSGNKLESLHGCPSKVGISFECEANAAEFTADDIKQNCKVGRKVKTCDIKPVRIFNAGNTNYPTVTKVDKYRFTTFDGIGLCLSFHVRSFYMKGKYTLMEISYWTKYGKTNLYKELDGLDSLPKEECERFKEYIGDKIDTFISCYHFDQIDWNNWDIPTSETDMIENGHSPLHISIPDHPSLRMETKYKYVGDGWLGGAPVYELDIKPLFYK